MNRKLFAGVEVTPETLAVDVVREVGPGGDFLSHRQTAKQVRKAQWRPTILNRQGHVRWQEEGGLDLKEKARLKALKLLAEHEPAPLDEAMAAISCGLLTVDEVLDIITQRGGTELVLTGRDAPEALVQAAHLVTEMREIKHYFSEGQSARKGIEY